MKQTGIVIKSTGSLYRVLTPEGRIHDCRLRGVFKISGIKSTNPIAVGDRVSFTLENTDSPGVIVAIDDRKNYIIRKATNLSRQTHILASNIDQAIVLVTLAEPRTSTGFIDRFLVTCEAYAIPAVIVINKTDLLTHQEGVEALSLFHEIYRLAGYPVINVSAATGENLDAFKDLIKSKVSLLGGHSGVGKSTLINKVEPGLELRVNAISRVHGKGRHTTTFAEMFPLKGGGFIIDTPGIKEFGLAGVSPSELSHYFPEMRALFNTCKFDNCTHMNEPECRVRQAVEEGIIAISRYSNYIGMLTGQDTRQ